MPYFSFKDFTFTGKSIFITNIRAIWLFLQIISAGLCEMSNLYDILFLSFFFLLSNFVNLMSFIWFLLFNFFQNSSWLVMSLWYDPHILWILFQQPCLNVARNCQSNLTENTRGRIGIVLIFRFVELKLSIFFRSQLLGRTGQYWLVTQGFPIMESASELLIMEDFFLFIFFSFLFFLLFPSHFYLRFCLGFA